MRGSQIADLGCDLWILGEKVEWEASGALNMEADGTGRPGLGRVQAHLELHGTTWGRRPCLIEGDPSQ